MEQNTIKENYFIMGGHLANDLCHGSLPAILAYMYQQGRLTSYQEVAFLVMANTLVNAVVQPLAGYLADHKARPYLMPMGMIMASLGIMFTGICTDFLSILLLVTFNGIGLAIFHPAAGKLSNIFAGEKKGRGMSIFSVGGNIGFALGPIYFTLAYILLGLQATLLLCLPALAMLIIFIKKYPLYQKISLEDERRVRKAKSVSGNEQENYKGMAILLLLIFARSAAWFGLVSFLPLYFIHILGMHDNIATMMNGLVAVSGALATLLGGFFSDRFGYIKLVRIASILSIPFLAIFCLTNSTLFAILMLIPFAMLFFAGMSPIVVIGQKYLCLHVGMATGITVGLGISFGGLIAPALGKIGDNYGLNNTMLTVLALIILASLISFVIPKIKR